MNTYCERVFGQNVLNRLQQSPAKKMPVKQMPLKNKTASLFKLVTVEFCDYTGSFTVVGPDQGTRAEFVRTQLNQMKEGVKSKPVLLVISLAGVKVCSPDGKTVYMAHALRRISYATCDPEHRQFSFLAREPKGHFSLQYCHAFLTHTPDQAEELNS
ncbi:SH2 domain-containing protein 5-like, partial [Penaeus monodon]|uniref:SH2 domain-containing protein 5-like n=1 Tax=Penaeus monodon TaxID=6687 RepID=UPI0018A735D3